MSRPSGDWTRTTPVEARLVTWDSRPGIGVLIVAHGMCLPVFVDGLRLDPIMGAETIREGRTILMFTNEDAAWDRAVREQKKREASARKAARRSELD